MVELLVENRIALEGRNDYPMTKRIFIHIPKNVGVSVFHTLKDLFWDVQGYIKTHVIPATEKRSIFYGHTPTCDLLTEGRVEKNYFNNTLFFYVARNAWTRAASLYFYKDLERQGISFSEALRRVQNRNPNKFNMWNPQTWWLRGISKENTFRLRFEHLTIDFEFLCDFELGIPRRKLQFRNQNLNYSCSIRELYEKNPKAKDLVQHIYWTDIHEFDQEYPF